MRTLTVSRKKSFVGCMGVMKLCVEVSAGEQADLMIDKKPCRIIGRLKNGKTVTASVSEDAFTLYAIADKLSTDYCREIYHVEAGTEDVVLSGVCKFNPAAGNAFRFDNNQSETAVADRKKSKKTGTIVYISCILIGLVIGACLGILLIKAGDTTKPKKFEIKEMTVTLDRSFEQVKTDVPNAIAYSSNKNGVSFLVELPYDNTDMESFTEKEIGNAFVWAELYPQAKLVDDTDNSLVYIQYVNKDATAQFMLVIKKNGEDIWLCTFGTSIDNFEDRLDWMIEAAKTIRFA